MTGSNGDEKGKKPHNRRGGTPPAEFQWKKGCPSPNPSGRPKKKETLAESIVRMLDTEVETSGGVVTLRDRLASRTVLMAHQGDMRAIKLVLELDQASSPNAISAEERVSHDRMASDAVFAVLSNPVDAAAETKPAKPDPNIISLPGEDP